ncbi:uncharacterized protein LOC133420421 [Cololabis saira]|uniref:uncharacterized protein LOC133420421 n=1 Tax=Cololabis saira TaxID=129043 RepID=UPI002AD52273|nr:uncharacterized protein LOC133420421 [Cololabis saira]
MQPLSATVLPCCVFWRMFQVFVWPILLWAVTETGETLLPEKVIEGIEHQNISLICPYPADASGAKSLYIELMNVTSMKIIYRFDSRRVEDQTYMDESYEGRLVWGRELAKNGQIQFLLMDVRLNDTGKYLCVVVADGKSNSTTFYLNVTGSGKKLSIVADVKTFESTRLQTSGSVVKSLADADADEEVDEDADEEVDETPDEAEEAAGGDSSYVLGGSS